MNELRGIGKVLAIVTVAVTTLLALGVRVSAEPTRVSEADGKRAFGEVARALRSPRCRNCHPMGDAPLQGEAGTPHAMNVSRRSPPAGLPCTTCHREQNAPIAGGPPGAPHWNMPGEATPMPFEGKGVSELCVQLKDPSKNGGRTPEQIAEHMDHDPLIRWAWNAGPSRPPPPIEHAALVAAARAWAAAGAPCP